MKKLFAVLVALTLVLSMGTIALAADNGSITITNAVDKATYEIYRIFDLVSYDSATGNASYKLSEKWADFEAGDYFEINDNGYVDWKASLTDDADDVKAFVELAFAYADSNADVTFDNDATASGSTVSFTDLPLGYYLIDTSLGTLCSITTALPDVEITDKNQMPNIDKYVQEDSKSANNTIAADGWGKVNDAEIGQTVYYKSTVTVGLGATNYIMHDTMTEGLTFNEDSVAVTLADGTTVLATNYEVIVDPDDDCTFEVEFKDSFISTLDKDATLTVTYTATLNEKAKVAVTGNDNTVYLTCGENSEWKSDEHTTTTYTWKIDIFKFTMDGENKVSLAGAEFQLLRTEDDVNTAIGLVPVTTVNGETVAVPTYRLATENDSADDTTDTIVTDDKGRFDIVGLDEGTYYLHESKAPEGYNELAKDIKVVLTSKDYDDTNRTITNTVSGVDENGIINVENKTGTLLPETGGIGTTIFYIVGITLMLGAAIILISKKRMASFA